MTEHDWGFAAEAVNKETSETPLIRTVEAPFYAALPKAKPPRTKLRQCWECSADIGWTARYCPKCGADQNKKPIHVPWWLLITMFVLIISFIGFLAFFGTRETEWQRFERELRQEYGP